MKLLILISFVCLMWASATEASYRRKKAKDIAAMSTIKPNIAQDPPFPVQVNGVVYLLKKPYQKTKIRIVLSGLKPLSVHGFHIHEYGTINGDNGCGGAGGHYNPFGRTHGDRSDRKRHVGDLGNFKADKNGKIDVTIKDRWIRLSGRISVLGRAFVFHQLQDDLGRGVGDAAAESLRTGNAGARLACGVIAGAEVKSVQEKFR